MSGKKYFDFGAGKKPEVPEVAINPFDQLNVSTNSLIQATASDVAMSLHKMKEAMMKAKDSVFALGHSFVLVNDGEHKLLKPEEVFLQEQADGVIYTIDKELMKLGPPTAGWVDDYDTGAAHKVNLASHMGMDLAMKPDYSAVVAILNSGYGFEEIKTKANDEPKKYYDEEFLRNALAKHGIKLVAIAQQKLPALCAMEIHVRVELPQGGCRDLIRRFDYEVLEDQNKNDLAEFIMAEIVDELSEYASGVKGEAHGNDSMVSLSQLRSGLAKIMCDTHNEFIAATHLAYNNGAHPTYAATAKEEHCGSNWMEKLRMRGLRSEYVHVELWSNSPLVQLRAKFLGNTRYFGLVKKDLVVEFSHQEQQLDDIMTVAVYLLNDRGTDIMRAHTGL